MNKKIIKPDVLKVYKRGRKFVFDIGEISITRIVLNPKEYETIKQYFTQILKP